MSSIIKPISEIEKLASEFISNSIAKSTKKAYLADWKVFQNWCDSYRINSLPATDQTVGLFITSLDGQRSMSTIKRYISSISQIHLFKGYESPTRNEYVRKILKGISRKNLNETNKACPISWAMLKKMADVCGISALGQRNATMLLVGWSCALRRSELVSLRVEDVEFVDEGMIVTIRHSKTDTEGKGEIIGVPMGPRERYCPVSVLKKWISISKTNDGFLFRRLRRDANGFWTKQRENIHVDDKIVSIIVKKCIKKLGGDSSRYSGHSLRRGFATEAASHGIPWEILKRHTRHKTVTSLEGYIDRGSIFLDNPLSNIFYSIPGSGE